jgi:hypothetical protein
MQLFGDINQQGLAMMGGATSTEGTTPAVGSRMFDSDGDGRNDLILVDNDSDGTVDGVVRALDSDGDGKTDTYVQYNEDGGVASIGRVNPMTGQFDVVYEEPGLIDKILDFLGLKDLDVPEDALFTTFDDPYLMDTFGTYGVEVSDDLYESVDVEPTDVMEMSDEEYESLDTGVTVVDEGNATPGEGMDTAEQETPSVAGSTQDGGDVDTSAEAPQAESPQSAPTGGEESDQDAPSEKPTPTIVSIEDRSGDGSSLWAKVDIDGDRLADTDAQVSRTSVGDYYADINQDGYSETVAHDMDMDGRIDTVDTTGKGSSTAEVAADQVVEPGSDHMVDKHSGENDDSGVINDAGAAEREATSSPEGDGWEVTDVNASGDTGGGYDAAADDGGSVDASGDGLSGDTSFDSGSGDAGSSYDAGSSTDAGYSGTADSYDAGSTSTVDTSSSGSYSDSGSSTE